MNDAQWHSLIFNFSHIPHLLCALQQIPLSNNYKGKGQVARGEMERGTGYWGAGMARLSYGPTSSMRLTQGMDHRQAGLHAAVALVTYSNEARVSTDTSKISLFSFHPLSHFFPSLLRRLSFYPPFPPFIHSLSWTKPDHRHAADVMVAIVTEAAQQQGCAERVRSGGKVTMGH